MTAAERRWCWARAALVMALTLAPYLWCWWHTPPGRQFCWVLYGRDDHAVYLAWMRQAADGHFFLRNLFTTDPQSGRLSNVFFFLLGQPVRFLGVPAEIMLQIARLGFGTLLLVLIYRFACYFTDSLLARRAAFWLAAVSAGLGWGAWLGWYSGMGSPPSDVWQPEGFTCFSIYSTALFAAATSAIVGILCLLLEAERTGRRRYAAWAGLLALLLGNFHSYDILHIVAAWGLYLLLKTATRLARREGVPWRSWGDAVACAVIGLPTTLLQYYVYRTDPVFQQRADYQTLSPEFTAYALGYGLVLILALGGAVLLVRGHTGSKLKLEQRWMPAAWAVAGFGVAYLPLAFNRKMIMGTHVPLCLLAGIALAALGEWVLGVGWRRDPALSCSDSNRRERERAKPNTQHRFRRPAVVVGLVVLLTAPTSILRMWQDVRESGDRPEDLNWFSAYWPQADLKAMAWIHDHTPPDAAFFCTPLSGRYIAAAAGRAVYAAHWGETPHFAERIGPAIEFFRKAQSADERLLQLRTCGTGYIYQGTAEQRAGQVDFSRDPGLEKLYDADGVMIYRVKG